MSTLEESLRTLLDEIYESEKGALAYERILPILKEHAKTQPHSKDYYSERDVLLITYGDSLKHENEAPLATLHRFANERLKGAISHIHILPFSPYSSDDGFSVIDYYAVDEALGGWDDIRSLSGDFKLMFDLVLNHISAQSGWFRNYLQRDEGYEDLAIEVDPGTDVSGVTRPRALPLLTEFAKDDGTKVHLWTTFSADQVDLNYAALNVLEHMLRVYIRYFEEGATIIRLDAIAYLWKEIGTSCIHLPQTHAFVKLLRLVADTVSDGGIVLTETNVPHKENVSYFGNGYDEAQMVYNFTLPPLTFYSFVNGTAKTLSAWAKTLSLESEETTYLNFTASHDGIGVRPLEGIIEKPEVEALAQRVKANGGRVSYKTNSDGSESPYELNITYVDAMKHEGDSDEQHAKRFLASQAVALVLPGIPAVYIHSILGSHNFNEGVEQTGRARTINREKLSYDAVVEALDNQSSFRHLVFSGYRKMITARVAQKAFHPNAAMTVLDVGEGVFAVKRERDGQTIYSFINVTNAPQRVSLKPFDVPETMVDVLGTARREGIELPLQPYDVVWLSHEA